MTSSTSGGAFYGGRRATLMQIGAGLGVAGNCVGWLTFLLLCFGFGAAAPLGLLALLLGIAGMILTIVGATLQKDAQNVDTHVLASLFISLFAIVGGLFEMGVWLNWAVVNGAGKPAGA